MCVDKVRRKILHQCPLRDGLYYIHDLEWLGSNLLSMAPEVTVSREHSKQIQAYIAGITMEAMVLRKDVVLESRRA